jgi:two-component system cell cycle response regulator DivK
MPTRPDPRDADTESPPAASSTTAAKAPPALRRNGPEPRGPTQADDGEPPLVVLVVDDQHENCALYREFLGSAGFVVFEAHNGGDALRCALAETPDVIVMDLAMPVVDGYTATRLLKGDGRTRHIPVVAVTASGFDCHQDAIDAGCDAFLVKPCLPEDLEAVLRSSVFVHGRKSSGHARRAMPATSDSE